MKNKIIVVVLVVLLALSLSPTLMAEPATRRGGEVLWQKGKTTLYQCGPDKADICFDDGIGVTKVYVAP